MFPTTRKQAQQIARQLLAGHCTLIAWWTLRHAGVLDAIRKMESESHEGLDPLVHATRTNMSPEVLEALVDYLGGAGLLARKKDGVRLTADGNALFDHEDAVLQLFRAYQPILDISEHLLARLKSTANASSTRKSEYLVESQARRYPAEVYPAVDNLIAHHHFAHLLDVTSGTGDLLIHIARNHKKIVGVGIGADGIAMRRANAAIADADLERRLIAVTASPVDVLAETQRTFDRIGISRQLWKEIDCIIATHLFSDLTTRPEEITRILSALPKNFPTASFLFAEPVASERFDKNYYAPEFSLLLRLARSQPWPPEKWRDILQSAGLTITEETPLTTDGLMIFLCQPDSFPSRSSL